MTPLSHFPGSSDADIVAVIGSLTDQARTLTDRVGQDRLQILSDRFSRVPGPQFVAVELALSTLDQTPACDAPSVALTAADVVGAIRETLGRLFAGASAEDYLRVGLEAVELEHEYERLTGDDFTYLCAAVVSDYALGAAGASHPDAA